MTVAKSDVIAGLPAELARAIVRRFRGREMTAAGVADLLDGVEDEPGTVLAQLEAADTWRGSRPTPPGTSGGTPLFRATPWRWQAFGKPISRKTADRLVSELVERARAYNADQGKPLFIDALRVFGSYLDPQIDPLGDVDLELTYGRRITDPKLVADYASAGGRSFNTYVDRLLWPMTELVQHLKNRSAFINITTEDIALLTDRSETIYSIDTDMTAVPAPADRTLIGR